MATSFKTDVNPGRQTSGRVEARPLTEIAVRNLKAGESRTDGALPVGNGRLVVSCTKSRGQLRKVWTFRYRRADLRGEVTIGDHPALSLGNARDEARKLLQLVQDGKDPKAVRMESRVASLEAERQTMALGSLRSLLDTYVAHLVAEERQSANDVAGIFRRHVIEPWPALCKLPANRITPEAIRDVLARMVSNGIGRQTNVARAFLRAAFTHGAHADLDPRRAAGGGTTFRLTANPVALLPQIREFETARTRALTDGELVDLWHGLDGLRLELAHTIRCEILLGGQRFLQLLRATWSDYDTDAQVLRLIDSKGRRDAAVPHLIPVPARVQGFLRELRSLNGAGTYIFSTTAGLRPIHQSSLPSHFVAIATKSAETRKSKLPPFQGRDLRRSVETRLQAMGVSREVRAQLLSHGRTSGVQQKHYERHEYLVEKAEALRLLDEHIQTVLAPQYARRHCEAGATNSNVDP